MIYISVIAFLFSYNVYSVNSKIEGSVREVVSGKFLSGVRIKTNIESTTSDSSGEFDIKAQVSTGVQLGKPSVSGTLFGYKHITNSWGNRNLGGGYIRSIVTVNMKKDIYALNAYELRVTWWSDNYNEHSNIRPILYAPDGSGDHSRLNIGNNGSLSKFPHALITKNIHSYVNPNNGKTRYLNNIFFHIKLEEAGTPLYAGTYRLYLDTSNLGNDGDLKWTNIHSNIPGYIPFRPFEDNEFRFGNFYHLLDIKNGELQTKNIITDVEIQPSDLKYRYSNEDGKCLDKDGNPGHNEFKRDDSLISSITNLTCYQFESKKISFKSSLNYNLKGALFKNTEITSGINGDLSGATFDGVKFKPTTLLRGMFSNTRFINSDLSKVIVHLLNPSSGLIIDNTILDSAEITSDEEYCIENVKINNSKLDYTSFNNIFLCNSSFTNLKSEYVSFKFFKTFDSLFSNVNFSNSSMQNVALNSTVFNKFSAINLNSSYLSLYEIQTSTLMILDHSKNQSLTIDNSDTVQISLNNAFIDKKSSFGNSTFVESSFDESILHLSLKAASFQNVSFKSAKIGGVDNDSSFFQGFMCSTCDFTGATLKKMFFELTVFDNATFMSTNLEKINFKDTRFVKVNFLKSKFDDVKIQSSYFKNSFLLEISGFETVSLNSTEFIDVQMPKLKFGKFDFVDLRFSRVNLEGSRFNPKASFLKFLFDNVQLKTTTFDGCSFEETDFTNIKSFGEVGFVDLYDFTCKKCNFKKVNFFTKFKDTSFEDVTFKEVKFDNGAMKSSFKNVIFEKIDLNAPFWNAEFDNVTWVNSDLKALSSFKGSIENSNFKGSKFYDISFNDVAITNSNFENVTIENAFFSNPKFTNVSFKNSKIFSSHFIDSSFSGGSLAGTNFKYSKFSGLVLSNVILKEGPNDITNFDNQHEDLVVKMDGVSYDGDAFSGIKFNRSSFEYVDFSNAGLVGTSFNSSKINFSYFENVNLKNSHITNTVISETSFMGADFTRSFFENFEFLYSDLSSSLGWSTITMNDFYSSTQSTGTHMYNKFTGSDLSDVDLSRASLFNIDFSDTTLRYTIFDRAKISNSSFINASFERTTFYDSTVSNSDFSQTNLEDTDGLSPEYY